MRGIVIIAVSIVVPGLGDLAFGPMDFASCGVGLFTGVGITLAAALGRA